MKKYYKLLLCAFLLTSCIKPDNLDELNTVKHQYFDVEGLIKSQIEILASATVQIEKQTSVNGKAEKLSPTNINWKKELSLFADADINKPILLKSYQTDSVSNKGGMVLRHTALEEDLRVRTIEVTQTTEGQPIALTVDFQEHNPVYTAEQHLSMQLMEGKVIGYQLRGFQKMKMQDTLFYHVETAVKWLAN